MSGFDIARIIAAPPLRETGAQFPSRAAPSQLETRSETRVQSAPNSGVAVETSRASALADAGEAPIDLDRVAEIRSALEQGQYPLKPAKIADAMIAAKLMLSVSE